MLKLVTLVNKQDEVVGSENIFEAHSHPAKLHRAISVWLVNKNTEILFQKRSLGKLVGPGLWGNAVCGNVLLGESYLRCAHRRLSEEIGVKGVKLRLLYKFTYNVRVDDSYGEHEIDQVYLGFYNGKFRLNSKEVSETKWVKRSDLKNLGQKVKLGPWTQIMLEDERLLSVLPID